MDLLFFSSTRLFSSDALVETRPGEIGIVSGIPEEQLGRKAKMHTGCDLLSCSYCDSTRLGQSWEVENQLFIYTEVGKSGQLMGWTSTGDPYANVVDAGLSFDSAEAAKAFAEKHGWDYVVKKHHTPILKVKSYADNFKWKGPPKAEGN